MELIFFSIFVSALVLLLLLFILQYYRDVDVYVCVEISLKPFILA